MSPTTSQSLASTSQRGVAGTLFVHKIAGYHAETGADLDKVAAEAAAAAHDIVSLGMVAFDLQRARSGA